MRRHPPTQIGQFAGNPEPPQALDRSMHAEVLDSLTGDPALRLRETTGRARFTGGSLTLQRFARVPGRPGSPEQLEMLPVAINTRRSLNRFRGFPPD